MRVKPRKHDLGRRLAALRALNALADEREPAREDLDALRAIQGLPAAGSAVPINAVRAAEGLPPATLARGDHRGLSQALSEVLRALDDQTLTRDQLGALRARLGLPVPRSNGAERWPFDEPGPFRCEAPGEVGAKLNAEQEEVLRQSQKRRSNTSDSFMLDCHCEFGWQHDCPVHGTGE